MEAGYCVVMDERDEKIRNSIVKVFLKMKEKGQIDSVDFEIEDGELKQIFTKKQEKT